MKTIERNKGDQRLFSYYKPPTEKQRLSDFDKQVFGLIKEKSQCSINDILIRLITNYDPQLEQSQRDFKERLKVATTTGKVFGAIYQLTKYGCVTIIEKNIL